MVQSLTFEYDEDEDEFHLILDGEDMGPVDMDDLREESSKLNLHFKMFRDAPEYEPVEVVPDDEEHEDPQTLSEEEIDEIIEGSIEDDIEDD